MGRSTWIHIALVIVAIVLVYGSTISHGFVFDDPVFITDWKASHSLRNVGRLLAGDLPPGHEGVYRPLRSIHYAISWALFHGNPMFYRMQAMLIHIAATILVYMLARLILRHPLYGLIAALVFALHPGQTQAITFTTISFDVTGIMWMLLSLTSTIIYIRKDMKLYRYISILSGLLAVFTYEATYILPAVTYLITRKEKHRGRSRQAIIWSGIIVALALSTRIILSGLGSTRYFEGTYIQGLFLGANGFVLFIRQLLFPYSIQIYHSIAHGMTTADFTASGIEHLSISDWQTVVALTIATVGIVTSVRIRESHPLITLLLIWIMLAWLPFSNLIPGSAVYIDQYLYGAIIPFSLLIVIGFKHIPPYRHLRTGLLVLLLLLYSTSTITRNRAWQDEVTLWETTTRQIPTSASAHLGLGNAYDRVERFEDAIAAYEQSRTLSPDNPDIHSNLGVTYAKLGRFEESIGSFEQAIIYNADEPTYMVNLGRAYEDSGDTNAAMTSYERAFMMLQSEDTWSNATITNMTRYARLLINDQNISEAIEVLHAVVEKDPSYTLAANNLGILYASQGNLEDAQDVLLRAYQYDPTDEDVRYNLANVYAALGDTDEALHHIDLLLEANPSHREAQTFRDTLLVQ